MACVYVLTPAILSSVREVINFLQFRKEPPFIVSNDIAKTECRNKPNAKYNTPGTVHTEPVFVNLLRTSEINSKPGGIDSSESIPGLLRRLQIWAQYFSTNAVIRRIIFVEALRAIV